MLRIRLVRLALVVCPLAPLAVEAATIQHSEPLRVFRVADAGMDARGRAMQARAGMPEVEQRREQLPGAIAEEPATAGATTVTFNAFSRDFALELEPNGRLAAMQQQLALPPGTAAYRGKVAGRVGSWVRLVLTPAGPSGIVFDGETLYGIESGEVGSRAAAAGEPTMFRLADVYFAPGELGCEIGVAGLDGVQALAAMKVEFAALAAPGATLNLDLGAVADFEFSQRFGASANDELLARFNNVDGIFSSQLGVQITVAEIDIFTADNDPFTTTAATALLDQVAEYRASTPSQEAQGLTHLITGRDLDGNTAGVAFTGSVCATRQFGTRSFGAGLSEARGTALVGSLVAAHEIGHNFGAPHDGDANFACASTPPTFLMAPSISGSNQFSACSIAEMQTEIATASCLTPIGPADMAVSLPQVQDALAGVSFNHTVTVVNQGADAATGVSLAATTESPLTIVAAAAGGSSCTVAAQSASCALGSVGGGASRAVTLTLRSASVGTFDLTATVDADADTDSSDDTRTVDVTVAPVVDLVWSGSAGAVQLDTQTTVTAVLDNTGDFAASAVAVTAALSAGLRPDGASLGGTACTIAAQAITCPTRGVPARSNIALVVTATGVAAGGQQVAVNATSSEADRTPADNQSSIAVTVNAPPQGGGGGALSWWGVLALLAALGLRGRVPLRRRRLS